MTPMLTEPLPSRLPTPMALNCVIHIVKAAFKKGKSNGCWVIDTKLDHLLNNDGKTVIRLLFYHCFAFAS